MDKICYISLNQLDRCISLYCTNIGLCHWPISLASVKVGGLHPVQQPGVFWGRHFALPLVRVEPTQLEMTGLIKC